MVAVAPIPPHAPNDANWEITEASLQIGGPPGFIQNASIANGDALPTSASGVLAEPYEQGDDDLVLDDVSAWLPVNGTINLIETVRDTAGVLTGDIRNHWFTYHKTDGVDRLQFVRRIGGPEGGVAAGSICSQWRDITNDVDKFVRFASIDGSRIRHTADLSGVEWNSLVHRQYVTGYAEYAYWNSVYQQFSNKVPRMLCYFNPVRPTGHPGYTTWSASAGCEGKLLDIMPTIPQQIGNIVIPYTVEASPYLEDILLEPYEGNGAADFSGERLYDGDRMTPYVSRDAPTTLPALPWYPTGRIQLSAGGVPTDASGFGLKIFRVCPSGVGVNPDEDHYIEISNSGPDPKGWPFEDSVTPVLNEDKDSPGYGNIELQTVSAAEDATTWGAINLGGYCIEAPGIRVYLGSKNGTDEQIMLPRNATAVLVKNRQIFEAKNIIPEGTVVIEWGPCDGWQDGMDPYGTHRGIGATFSMSRFGGWLALRPFSRNNYRFRALFDNPTWTGATAESNTDNISTTGELLTAGDTDDFMDSGYLFVQDTQHVLYYKGKGLNKFTGVSKVRAGWENRAVPAGKDLRQAVWTEKWTDFVAWGTVDIPRWFWYMRGDDETIEDQNTASWESYRVWGWRASNGTDLTSFSRTPLESVEAGGIQPLHVIQRKNAVGGGVGAGVTYGTSDPISNHDSATRHDWEMVRGRPIGNREPRDTVVKLILKLGEFPSATVVEDITAEVEETALPGGGFVTANVPSGKLIVEAGSAQPYPNPLRPGQRLRTNLGYDFIYSGHNGNDTFYNVRKYSYSTSGSAILPVGDGATIPPGTTLTLVYDGNPAWKQRQNHKPAWVVRNSYTPVGLDFRRYQIVPSVTVQEDRSAIDGTIKLVPGGDLIPPGIQEFYVALGGPGGAYHYEQIPPPKVKVTDTVGDTMVGRIYGREWADFPLPPGTTLTMPVTASRIENCLIRMSRKLDPGDPNTYIANGEHADWDNVLDVVGLSSDRTYLPLTGGHDTLGPVTQIAILVYKMSDGGRVKINEIVPYAMIFDEPYLGPGNAAPRPTKSRTLDAGRVADEMLRLAGYPQNRRNCYGGPAVRGARISSGTWGEALDEWCERTGMVWSDGPLGVITVKPDPRVYGIAPMVTPIFRVRPNAVWGQIDAEEREQFGMSQITLEATNDVSLEHYIVTYPAQPLTFGKPSSPVKDKRAPSLAAAQAWARSILARNNGGWLLTIPIGHIDTMEPLDLIRVEVPMDTTGALFDGVDCMVLSTEYRYQSGIQTGTLTVEKWKTI